MFGPHLAGSISDKMLADIEVWKPKTGLIFNEALKQSHEIKAASPNTIWVGRPYKPDGEIEAWIRQNPIQAGLNMYEMVMGAPTVAKENINYWQTNNEVMQRGGDLDKLNTASIEFMKWLEGEGLKAAIGAFSVGNPSGITEDGGKDWQRFYPALRHAISNGHILGIHQYGKKSTGHLLNHKEFLIQRYERLVYPHFPDDIKAIKTICLEYGNDELTWSNWKMGWKEPYNNDINQYIAELKEAMSLFQNSNILGACGYTHGFENSEWLPYDTSEVGHVLADAFKGYSIPNPEPIPTPEPEEETYSLTEDNWVENCGLTQIIFRVLDSNNNPVIGETVEISWDYPNVSASQKTGTYQDEWGEFALQNKPVANAWKIRVKGKNWLTVSTVDTCNSGDKNVVWVTFIPNFQTDPTPSPSPNPDLELINWPYWSKINKVEESLNEGESYYKLIKGKFLGENESGGLHHIRVMNYNPNIKAVIKNNASGDMWEVPLDKSQAIGLEHPMYRHYPDGNTYSVSLKGEGVTKSDEVIELRMEGNRHVVYELTFQKVEKGATMPSGFDAKYLASVVKSGQNNSHNPNAALQKKLIEKGYTVILSDEVHRTVNGVHYVMQLGANKFGKEAFSIVKHGVYDKVGLYGVDGSTIEPLT